MFWHAIYLVHGHWTRRTNRYPDGKTGSTAAVFSVVLCSSVFLLLLFPRCKLSIALVIVFVLPVPGPVLLRLARDRDAPCLRGEAAGGGAGWALRALLVAAGAGAGDAHRRLCQGEALVGLGDQKGADEKVLMGRPLGKPKQVQRTFTTLWEKLLMVILGVRPEFAANKAFL